MAFLREWSEETAEQVVLERERNGLFRSLGDLVRRAPPKLSRDAIEHLVWVGGCDGFGLTRRELLWQVGLWLPPKHEQRDPARVRHQLELPLNHPYEHLAFSGLEADERLVAEYEVLGFAAGGHPFQLMRGSLGAHLQRGPGEAGARLACRSGRPGGRPPAAAYRERLRVRANGGRSRNGQRDRAAGNLRAGSRGDSRRAVPVDQRQAGEGRRLAQRDRGGSAGAEGPEPRRPNHLGDGGGRWTMEGDEPLLPAQEPAPLGAGPEELGVSRRLSICTSSERPSAVPAGKSLFAIAAIRTVKNPATACDVPSHVAVPSA
ncbi:MAG: hypothetical protein HYY94_02615 [Gemmatimonadetes bacterium]|nr:hypothetical protein [Gemmatimonadota bacterium]